MRLYQFCKGGKRGSLILMELLLGLILLVRLLGEALAESSPEVAIRVRTILASDQPKPQVPEPELSDLLKELRSTLKYANYELIGSSSFRLHYKERAIIFLVGDLYMEIIPSVAKKGWIELRTRILRMTSKGQLDYSRPLLSTPISLAEGGTYIMGGPRYREGALVVAITATIK